MKRIFIIIGLLYAVTLSSCGTYSSSNNFHSNSNRAIIKLPDGEVMEVGVKEWADAKEGNIVITTTDGRTFRVSYNNCILVDNDGGSE